MKTFRFLLPALALLAAGLPAAAQCPGGVCRVRQGAFVQRVFGTPACPPLTACGATTTDVTAPTVAPTYTLVGGQVVRGEMPYPDLSTDAVRYDRLIDDLYRFKPTRPEMFFLAVGVPDQYASSYTTHVRVSSGFLGMADGQYACYLKDGMPWMDRHERYAGGTAPSFAPFAPLFAPVARCGPGGCR